MFNSPTWRVDYRIGDHIELRNAGKFWASTEERANPWKIGHQRDGKPML